jgi:hypothetical protein
MSCLNVTSYYHNFYVDPISQDEFFSGLFSVGYGSFTLQMIHMKGSFFRQWISIW